ncbi:MAG: type IV pilus twitching motility protein PilT [Coxiellaceae bacterium]|nr:type IV pilus twitching motility protein PilT [Coxiellaceae bacterium]
MTLDELLKITVERNASDLHLSVGESPVVRIDGTLERLDDPELTQEQLLGMIEGILNDGQQKVYHDELETDLSYSIENLARFRVNVFHQQRGVAAVFRVIPDEIPTFEALRLPEILHSLCALPNGLLLVTGPTGSGKSTTLAAMVDSINEKYHHHIITIEDPIEFTYHNKNCLINQREVKKDTLSFNAALRSVLREDPDIILVGELRDLETIRLALTAAETGHLVLATLHTNSAAKTIDRLIDVFPTGEKDMIRAMLSESLRAVIAQTLLKRIGGGRIAAQEIMICTPAIRNLIRENKIPQIYSAIQTGKAVGMRTMEQHLVELAEAQLIEPVKKTDQAA